MSTTIENGDVSDDLHQKLSARAEQAGLSLADFVGRHLQQMAARPTESEIVAVLARAPKR